MPLLALSFLLLSTSQTTSLAAQTPQARSPQARSPQAQTPDAMARNRQLQRVVIEVARRGSRPAGGGPVQCEKCHADHRFLEGKTRNARGDSLLYVPDALLRDSRHQTLVCADCHAGFNDGYPHTGARTTAVPCQDCHKTEGAAWSASIHAETMKGQKDAPTCVNCHSAHQVLGTDDPRSPTYPLNVTRLCGSCHDSPRILDAYFKKPADSTARTAVGDYKRSVHGLAMSRSGLVISATCTDCHGAHKVLPKDSAQSSIGRENVAATCGACHVGVRATFDSSSHGRALVTGDTTATGHRAPVCVDCHGGHTVVQAGDPIWFRGVVQECGACHERLLATYDESYHGKATQLHHGIAAKCSDCHTPHSMLPAKDPRSSVNKANLVETCRQCHADANARFVEFKPHGDPRDAERNPGLHAVWLAMTTLLVGVFTFFGIHSAMWFVRLRLDGRRARAAAHAPDEPSTPRAEVEDEASAPREPDAEDGPGTPPPGGER